MVPVFEVSDLRAHFRVSKYISWNSFLFFLCSLTQSFVFSVFHLIDDQFNLDICIGSEDMLRGNKSHLKVPFCDINHLF